MEDRSRRNAAETDLRLVASVFENIREAAVITDADNRILRGIRGFEEIALWAACHHEEPDGSGYPFHLVADATPLPARILRVADIFQAMVQERPYRQGMDDSAVARFMAELVAAGRCEAPSRKDVDASWGS